MAEMVGIQGGKIQIVFLVDVDCKPRNLSTNERIELYKLKYEAVSLSVLRLLLHLNSSTGIGHPSNNNNNNGSLVWGFKFFNSNVLNFEYKRRRFYELSCESFQKFEQEMAEKFENVRHCGEPKAKDTTTSQCCAGVKALSCSLTETLHDFPWVSPDISSPSRNLRNTRTKELLHSSKRSTNLLFVVSDCPLGNDDLEQFLAQPQTIDPNEGQEDSYITDIFSPVLLKEFQNTCDLSLFWVDTGIWCLSPQKMDRQIKDWSGYHKMLATTKKLGGNLIPISCLVQDLGTMFHQSFTNSGKLSPTTKALDTGLNTNVHQVNNEAVKKSFYFSFGDMVKAFLNGKNISGLSEPSGATESLRNGLFNGSLVFKDRKICDIQLSPMIAKMNKSSTARKHVTHPKLSTTTGVYIPAFEESSSTEITPKNKSPKSGPQRSCREYQMFSSPGVGSQSGYENQMFSRTVDNTAVHEMEERENIFAIKGVIFHQDISPSWFHPTKLYSCISHEQPRAGTNMATDPESSMASSAEALQQLLTAISEKKLNLVVEFCDLESCAPVIGVLQPLTSMCAVLNVLKPNILLIVEKLLLRHKSHGYSLIPRDVIDNDTNLLPLSLYENFATSDELVPKVDTAVPMASREMDNDVSLSRQQRRPSTDKRLSKSYIRDIENGHRKNRKDCKDLFLKLKDHYSEKHSKLNQQPVDNAQQTLHRGRLLQDAAQKINQGISNEVEYKEDRRKAVSVTEMQESINIGSLDSEQTDRTEPNDSFTKMAEIKTVGDLKTSIVEDYQKCVNLVQSPASFSARVFAFIDQLKSSGELQDFDDVKAMLDSSLLQDSKTLLNAIESRDEALKKDQIILEYKIQVFLRLDLVNKYEEADQDKFADEITAMLRAISFQTDPTYLSAFLKNTIITRYAETLSKFLCLVYDGLMQKPPKEIQSPSRVSSEEDTPLKCRDQLPSISSRSESVEEPKSSRGLVRRHSMMDVVSKRREIAVPGKTKTTKHHDNKEKKQRRTSRSSGKKTAPSVKPVTPVKKVRRNLFMRDAAEGHGRRTSPRKQVKTGIASAGDKLSRRHSIASFSRVKKVQDTPVCKQSSRRMLRRQEWARRRSKTVIDDVTVVGESPLKDEEVIRPFPRRSPRRKVSTFYSASVAPSRATKAAKETNDDDPKNVSKDENNRTLYRATSMSARLPATSQGSPRIKFQRSLSLRESSSISGEPSSSSTAVREDTNNDSFSEVFLDPAPAETLFYDPKSTTRNPPSDGTVSLPSKNTPRSITTYSHLLTSSSPPITTTKSPGTSHLTSPSQSRSANKSATIAHSPSPVLFKSPSFSKSPAADQIYDIAIRLTPVRGSSSHPTLAPVGDISPRTTPRSSSKHSETSKSPTTRSMKSKQSPFDKSQHRSSPNTQNKVISKTSTSSTTRSMQAQHNKLSSLDEGRFHHNRTTPNTSNNVTSNSPITGFQTQHNKQSHVSEGVLHHNKQSPVSEGYLHPGRATSNRLHDSPKSPNTRSIPANPMMGSNQSPLGQGQFHGRSQTYEDGDLETVIKATPQLERKRSLFKNQSLKTDRGLQLFKHLRNYPNDPSQESLDQNVEAVAPGKVHDGGNAADNGSSTSVGQTSDVFTSPVDRKRKRLSLKRHRDSQSVSPLNQILKQRKNNRNSPGTSPRELSTKSKPISTIVEGNDGTFSERLYDDRKSMIRGRKQAPSDDDYGDLAEDHNVYVDEEDFTNEAYPDRIRNEIFGARSNSDDSTNSPNRSPCKRLSPSHQFRQLQPHFTPTALSAGSLKHLEESPVLIGSGTPSTSRSRKWSERTSPSHSKHKRLRHCNM